MALAVASALLNEFADGVCLVLLAPVSDPVRVLPTIGLAPGLQEARDRPLMDMVHAKSRQRGTDSASLAFWVAGQIFRVGSFSETKDWGCGRQTVWFSWTRAD